MNRLKLVKESDCNGVWYCIYVGSVPYAYKRDLKDAESEYDRIKAILIKGLEKPEVLREEIITKDNKSINENLTNQNVETIQENIHQ
jgi:hypothetical protein